LNFNVVICAFHFQTIQVIPVSIWTNSENQNVNSCGGKLLSDFTRTLEACRRDTIRQENHVFLLFVIHFIKNLLQRVLQSARHESSASERIKV